MATDADPKIREQGRIDCGPTLERLDEIKSFHIPDLTPTNRVTRKKHVGWSNEHAQYHDYAKIYVSVIARGSGLTIGSMIRPANYEEINQHRNEISLPKQERL